MTSKRKKIASRLSYELGRVLASIHQFHFPKAGLFGKKLSIQTVFAEGCSPYFEHIKEIFRKDLFAWQYLGDTQATKLMDFIEANKSYFPTISCGGCLVHSDFKPVNLLWGQNMLTVLDWEFAHSGSGLLDFGILLRHFKDFPLNIESLELGYSEHAMSLPADWIRRARICDMVNCIQLLNQGGKRWGLFESLAASMHFTMQQWHTLDQIVRTQCLENCQ